MGSEGIFTNGTKLFWNWHALISRCTYLRKKTKNSNCYCHSHLCSCCHSTGDSQAQDPAVSLQRIPPHLEEQDEHCPNNHGAEKGCCVRNCRSLKRRWIRARNSFRDKVEFAEYGKEGMIHEKLHVIEFKIDLLCCIRLPCFWSFIVELTEVEVVMNLARGR